MCSAKSFQVHTDHSVSASLFPLLQNALRGYPVLEGNRRRKRKKGTGSSICSTYLLPQILIFSMEIYKVCITDAFSPWSFVNAKHSRYTHSARSRARTTDLTFTKRCQVFFSLVSCCLFPPRFHFHHHYALYSLFYTARGK